MSLHRIAAAALMVAATGPVLPADDGLGRLFFTPEKRVQLERQRTLDALESGTGKNDSQVRVDGQAQRSSGHHTVWINGRARSEGETRTGVAIRPDPGHPERVLVDTGDERQRSLRVGETLDRDTGEPRSALGDGSIVVHRVRAGNARQ